MFLVFRKKIMKNAFAGFDKPRRTRRMHYKLAHGSEFQISAQFDSSAGANIRENTTAVHRWSQSSYFELH